MSKRPLFTCGLSLVLLVGLVAVSWAVVQPRVPVAEPRAQRPIKHYPNKAEAFPIECFIFEPDCATDPSGAWTPGLPGADPHPTNKRWCSADDTSWWFGIDLYNGYASDWRNYLDTDPHPVTGGGISLNFNHLVSIEVAGVGIPAAYDLWDIANLQISVNGGSFYPLDPHFVGWTGYAYAGTSSFAYGDEWNIGDNYGGWPGQNPSWPSCDASGITINPGDTPFRSEYSTHALDAADVVVFRFEFCSDPGYSSEEGDPVEGWYVDDVVVSNDNGTYANYGTNWTVIPPTLLMHPGHHIFPADWVCDNTNWGPDSCDAKSHSHSWWCPDTTSNHKSWLVSPWIQLPDTAELVWMKVWQDQFSPGAAIEGYLSDYYYWYVRTEAEMKWKELTHDYDRNYNTTQCDWDVSWRKWEDDSLYNGTFFIVPDKLPYGSKIQLAIKFVTDDVVQHTGGQDCSGDDDIPDTWPAARGIYIDDVTLWGTATGRPTYYIYGEFNPGHGVYAIDGYDDKLYVDNGLGYCSIYQVTIPKGADPNMHPYNPDATGPLAPRTFTLITSPYYFRGDCGWSGSHHAEFYVDENYIYYGPDNYGYGGIEQWERNPDGTFGSYLGRLAIPVPPTNGETFGFDADNNTWYTCSRERQVYTFEMGVDTQWQYEFTYPSYGGDHHDGLEFVFGYLWVSDMTSDWIGQWEYTGTGSYNGWNEVCRFQYSHPRVVEGMGFGGPVLNHFWISAGPEDLIYEVGGGELQVAVEGIPDQCIYVEESFETFDLDDYVVGKSPFTWTWSGNVDIGITVDGENVVTLSYPDGWWGSEMVVFTVTDANGIKASDGATFAVNPRPVILAIPDQNWPFPPFDLDDYLDPDCGIDPGDITWTASGMVYLEVEIDSETHIVTLTNPSNSTESEVITFTATAFGCAGEEVSDSTDVKFNMIGAICGDVTLNNGNPVANVTVKVIDADNNQVGDPHATGSDGGFYFDTLLVGTYSVMIVTPLGYSVSPAETQTGIAVIGYPCTEVYFVLTPTITSNDCRTIGYWKHQFDVYLSGRGHAQESEDDLWTYLDLVHLHFDVLGVYIDLENFNFEDAKNVLTVKGGRLMQDRAKQQLFGLLFNFVSGRIGNETVISEDGRVAAEAVTYVATLINDGDPANDELAKTICDLINNGQMVEPSIIPESPERYKVNTHVGIPTEYSLNQNYPNPFNPQTTIRYALAEDAHVTLVVYNIAGQEIETLVKEEQQAGYHQYVWDGKDAASGIYFYRLQAGDFVQTRKMVVLK